MRILSEADNAKNTTFSKEGMIQTMNAIHRRALQVNASDDKAWKKVALQCAQSIGLEYLKDVEHQATFVERLSGGPDAKFLKEIEAFLKASKVVREIDSRFLADLATSGTWIEASPDFAIALVKASISCAVNFLEHGVADVFKPTDLYSCQAKRATEVKTAQAAIMKFKSIGDKLGIKDDAAWVRVEGGFSSRVALYTFNKKSVGRKVYDSIQQIGVDSFSELKNEYKSRMDGIACPWHVVPIAEAPKTKGEPKTVCRQMRSVASGGQLDVSNIVAMGFSVGDVVEKSDKKNNTTQKYQIKRLDERVAIVVSLTEPDTEMTLEYSKLIEYGINKSAKAKVSILNNNP